MPFCGFIRVEVDEVLPRAEWSMDRPSQFIVFDSALGHLPREENRGQ